MFEYQRDKALRAELAMLRARYDDGAVSPAVYPEPDLERAAALLAAGGLSLDSVSASNMRHVVEGVSAIARKALRREP
jgi:hypothetical protein